MVGSAHPTLQARFFKNDLGALYLAQADEMQNRVSEMVAIRTVLHGICRVSSL